MRSVSISSSLFFYEIGYGSGQWPFRMAVRQRKWEITNGQPADREITYEWENLCILLYNTQQKEVPTKISSFFSSSQFYTYLNFIALPDLNFHFQILFVKVPHWPKMCFLPLLYNNFEVWYWIASSFFFILLLLLFYVFILIFVI